MAEFSCIVCVEKKVNLVLDFGLQPPSNRYLSDKQKTSEMHPLRLGLCGGCGCLQLCDPMPPENVRSRYEWISYNEPEPHLDAAVEAVMAITGLREDALICGLTYKDDSTLKRFALRGIKNYFRCDFVKDFGLDDPLAGLESLSSALTVSAVERIADKFGSSELVVFRHVLEHARNPVTMLEAVKPLLSSSGFLLLEVPDCRKFIEMHDHTFVWEEHVAYFYPEIVRGLLGRCGFYVVWEEVYSYPLEDSLMVLAKLDGSPMDKPGQLNDSLSAGLIEGFGSSFRLVREKIHEKFLSLRRSGKRIAIFGAGHFAARFINIYGVASFVDCVIDDNPQKQGFLMPGSAIPIVGSDVLNSIDFCLLSVSPASEENVVGNHSEFAGRGTFSSIYAGSPRAFLRATDR